MEGDLPHPTDAMALQGAGVLEATECPFYAHSLSVEALPGPAEPGQGSNDPGVVVRRLPPFAVAVGNCLGPLLFQRATLRAAPEEVMSGGLVRLDVLHRLLAEAHRLAVDIVDAVVQAVLGRGLAYVDDWDDVLLEQVSVVRLTVVSPVGQQATWLDPWVGIEELGHDRLELGCVVYVGRGDGEGQRDAVGCIGDKVQLVAEAPFGVAIFCFGCMLHAPAGVGVADYRPVGVAVSQEEGGVYRQDRAEGRQWLVLPVLLALDRWHQVAELVGDFDQGLLDEVLVIGQAGDEPAEGALAGDLIVEAADLTQLPAPSEALDKLVVVADFEDELGAVGPVHGPGVVSRASGLVVRLEGFEQGIVVQVVEDLGQKAVAALGRLRDRLSLCRIIFGHEELTLPCGWKPSAL